MNRTITFNELRKIKDSLPSGSMHRIADELNLKPYVTSSVDIILRMAKA